MCVFVYYNYIESFPPSSAVCSTPCNLLASIPRHSLFVLFTLFHHHVSTGYVGHSLTPYTPYAVFITPNSIVTYHDNKKYKQNALDFIIITKSYCILDYLICFAIQCVMNNMKTVTIV